MKKVISVIFLFSFILLAPNIGFAENTNGSEKIDLSVKPGKVLFDLVNMKPGDSVKREILIKNNGNKEFNYIITNDFISGDRVFFNQFDLIIEGNEGKLYEGKLYKFDELAPRILESKSSENLYFYVKIPMELGNEFQNLSSDFQFKIYVEGTLGGVIPVDNRLPTTGSEIFNLLATGAALLLAGFILFSYLKRKKVDTKSS